MKEGFIRECTPAGHVDHPVVSIMELKHWIEQIKQSGYLAEKKKEGVTFEIIESNI